jgi:hypothetical protein
MRAVSYCVQTVCRLRCCAPLPYRAEGRTPLPLSSVDWSPFLTAVWLPRVHP